jgi:serine protease Do/serine protease DegQ
MAREIAVQLARYGQMARGELGAAGEYHPAGMPAFDAGRHTARAMVARVRPESPAEKAGLKPGDLIVAVNGKQVVSAAQLRARVGLVRVGGTVELELLRNGAPIIATAVVVPPAL